MTGRREGQGGKTGRLLALIVVAATVLGTGPAARAHVTDTDMPDAVAEMEYQILLDFQPDRVDVRNKLAMVLLRKKKYPEAEAEFRKVLTAQPANANARDGLGLVMLATGRAREALSEFEAAIQASPKDVMARYHLGQALDRLGRRDEAQASYRQALELTQQPGAASAAEVETIRKAMTPSPVPGK